MPHHWHDIFLWLPIFASLFTSAHSALSNRTIDDTLGDRITQFIPVYEPETLGIWEDASCVSCAIQPSKDLAFDGTWTASTFRPESFNSMSIQLQFTGVAVYVFFILADNQGAGITTRTVCRFLLDGTVDTDYVHEPTNRTSLEYNALVYQKHGLANTTHTVTILTDTSDPNIASGEHIFVNFDYAVYTFDDGVDAVVPTVTPSSQRSGATATATATAGAVATPASVSSSKKAPVAAIVGVIIGILVVITAAGIALYFYRERKRKDLDEHLQNPPLSTYPNPTQHHLPFDTRQFYSQTAADGRFNQTEIPGNAPAFGHGQSEMMSISSRPSFETLGTSSRLARSSIGFGNTGTSGTTVPYSPPPGGSHTLSYGPRSTMFSAIASGASNQPSLTEGTSPPTSLSAGQTRSSAGPHSHLVVTNSAGDGASLRESRQLELGRKMAAVQRELSGTVAEVQQRSSSSEVADLRSQVNQLREQLGLLRRQTQSPWALGLSDDPPPGYTPVV